MLHNTHSLTHRAQVFTYVDVTVIDTNSLLIDLDTLIWVKFWEQSSRIIEMTPIFYPWLFFLSHANVFSFFLQVNTHPESFCRISINSFFHSLRKKLKKNSRKTVEHTVDWTENDKKYTIHEKKVFLENFVTLQVQWMLAE